MDAQIVELDPQPTAAVRIRQPMKELDLVAAGGVGRSELPGGAAAKTVHLGTYDGLSGTYDALHEWIHARSGYDDGAGPWESYLDSPSGVDDPTRIRTEVVWPLVRG